MALNFLDLTNDLLKRLNETNLTQANFSTASNIHKDAQNHVNATINRIHREQFEWPFQHVRELLTCTPGEHRYAFPKLAKSVAFDSFRLKRDLTLNISGDKLKVLDYEEFISLYPDFEDDEPEQWGVPEFVVRNRDLSFTLYPIPREAYEVRYEYYELPVELSEWDSITTVPEFFRWVILEGATYYAYTFRGALEEAAAANTLFEEGLKDMRALFINRFEYVRSPVIRR